MSNISIYVKITYIEPACTIGTAEFETVKIKRIRLCLLAIQTITNRFKEKNRFNKPTYTEMLLSHLKCILLQQKATFRMNTSFSSMSPVIMKRYNHIDKVSYPILEVKTEIFSTLTHLNCTLSFSIYEIINLFAQANTHTE